MKRENRASARVAIITRTRDRTLLLRRAIESVIRQRFEDWIHVIVNDGGPTSAVDLLVSEYRDLYRGRIVVQHNPESLGMQTASNIGLEVTDSEFVVVHDDDDSWAPGFLRKVMNHFRWNPQSNGVVTYATIIHERIEDGVAIERGRSEFPVPPHINLFRMAAENQFPPIAFVYRRSVHDEIGVFDNRFTVLGDWDFNLRFLLKYDIDVLPEKLAFYHHREPSTAGSYGNSVGSGADEHVRKLTYFQNLCLRDDLQNQRMGLGFLTNMSRAFLDESRRLEEVRDLQEDQAATMKYFLPFVQQVDIRLHRAYSQLYRMRSRTTRYWVPKFTQAKNLFSSFLEHLSPKREVLIDQEVETWIDAIVAGMERHRCVSFDIFDTMLYRVVARPTDLFSLMEYRAAQIFGRNERFFHDARVRAEHQARLKAEIERQTDEIALDEIYAELATLLAVDAGEPGLAELKQLELDWEQRLLRANPVVLELFNRLRAAGKQIVCTSDMYLDSVTLRDLLASRGFEPDRIFVSNEHGVSKATGGLYRKVLENLQLPASAVAHIGDNSYVDVDRARAAGLTAFHFTGVKGLFPFAAQRSQAFPAEHLSMPSSIALGLAKGDRCVAFAERRPGFSSQLARQIGYELTGPLLVGFSSWCAEKALADGRKRLLFLARDGYYLERVFQKLKAKLNLPLESRYVYASRRLFAIPALHTLDEETLDFLLKPTPKMTLRHYLERVGLNPEEHVEHAHDCGLPDLDRELTDELHQYTSPHIGAQLRRLFLRLQNQILSRAAAERAHLHSYLGRLGLSSDTDAIVDVGWNASNLKAINRLCIELTGRGGLPGYYFGTWEAAESAILDGCNLSSYFVHLGQSKAAADLILECVELLEVLINAPHPSIIALEGAPDAGWTPVYGESELTRDQHEWLEEMHEAAMRFVDDFLEVGGQTVLKESLQGYLELTLERILRFPTKREAALLGRFRHRDGFGGGTPVRYLARLPSLSAQYRNRSSLRLAYLNSYWKKGMLAQMNDFQRLRALS